MNSTIFQKKDTFPLKDVGESEFGNMKYKGPFGGSISYYGLPLDVLKSGIQKYIRRGDNNKALWCMAEYDLFREFDERSYGIVTNMVNRLVVICGEDVGLANINTILDLDKELKIFEKYKKDDKYKSREALINIINTLANSKKIRLFSHIRSTYMNPEFYKVIATRYPKLYKRLDYTDPDISNKYKFKNTKEEEDLRIIIDKIISGIKNNEDIVFRHIAKFLSIISKEKGYVSRFRKKSGEYILWELLINYCKEGLGICGYAKSTEFQKYLPYLEVLMDWYKNRNNSRNENIIYLINAVLILMKKIDISQLPKFKPMREIYDELKEKIDQIYNRSNKISLDKFVFDMHTKLGRQMGMTKKDFGEEGSLVLNEDTNYLNEVYLEIYKLFKNYSLNNLESEKTPKKLKLVSKNSESLKTKLKIIKRIEFDGTELILEEKSEKKLIKNPLLVNMKPKYLEKENKFVHMGSRPSTYYGKFTHNDYKETNVLVKGPYKSNEITEELEYSCMVDNLKAFLGLKKIGVRIITMLPTHNLSYGISQTETKKYLMFKDYGSGVDTYSKKNFINGKGIDTKLITYDKEQGNQFVKWLKNNTITKEITEQLVFIVLFRQMVESSDTNLTNILLESGSLLSIDENHSKTFKLNIFFSHHQKKELTDLIDQYIRENNDYIINRLKEWSKIINSKECISNLSQFGIYIKNKWGEKLMGNISSLKDIVINKKYSFK